jgi:hypothetical protein
MDMGDRLFPDVDVARLASLASIDGPLYLEYYK